MGKISPNAKINKFTLLKPVFLNAIVEKRSPQMRTSLLIVEKYQQKLINNRKHFITHEKSFQTKLPILDFVNL
jgi:hypothetical protein